MLVELLPVDEDEPDMTLMPTMVSNYPLLDNARIRVIEACLQVLDSVRNGEGGETPNVSILALLQTAQHTDTAEEKDMMQHEYDDDKYQTHRQEHLLLCQPLISITDFFTVGSDAGNTIARRKLISLFDRHFTDADIEYANPSVPESEQRKDTNEEEGDDIVVMDNNDPEALDMDLM